MTKEEKQEYQEMLKAMETEGKKEGKFWSPKSDRNKIRFLPPMKKNEEKLPYLHHRVHWINSSPYECLNQSMSDETGNFHEAGMCPACKIASKLWKNGDHEEQELAKQLFAKDRYVFRIIDRSKESEQDTPEFYEVGPSIYKKFKSILTTGDHGNIVHPTEGRDFIIVKEGVGRQTKYDNSLPSADKGALFEEKEMIKSALTKATEMKFNLAIKFKSEKEVSDAVKEFLNPDEITSEKSAEKPSPKSIKDDLSNTSDDDAVDDLLNEFTDDDDGDGDLSDFF